MLKYLGIAFLLMFCSCVSFSPNEEKAKERSSKEVISLKSFCYTTIKNRSQITLYLKSACLPTNAKYAEIIFDKIYYGYFPLTAPIYLPNYIGQKRLVIYYTDINGKSLGTRTEYILN